MGDYDMTIDNLEIGTEVEIFDGLKKIWRRGYVSSFEIEYDEEPFFTEDETQFTLTVSCPVHPPKKDHPDDMDAQSVPDVDLILNNMPEEAILDRVRFPVEE